ncbi:hypothetical protein [Sphingorhabdus sp. YGSMI21]|uniref:hypothetical protein n=1 Tax=Sphingorhabdus sp. YGSMI21 TaxID=2077182 RepID=UPI000C1F77C1|nr:hypothetical protein [Sphingorhabdus sp. YGSMI21]ATW02339.1 hypothetical protein CHN51_01405 [Sphingorhabdus sp. YGSMI21]
MRKYLICAIILAMLAGCSNNPRAFEETTGNPAHDIQLSSADATGEEPGGQSLCPGDGPTLPVTGICEDRARIYLDIAGGDAPQIPDHCYWSVNETAIVDNILLYLAATCDGKKARLGYAGGAHFSDLNLAWSAVANEAQEDTVLIRIGGAEPDRPHQNILFYARDAMDDPVAAERCVVRPAGLDGWTADALVVDVGAEEAAKSSSDSPRSTCGRFGLDEGNSSFWRVFQGYSWWFQLSQDVYQDIDPRSLTLVRPDGAGGWTTVE